MKPGSCDGCSMCCTLLGVKELDKAPGVPCRHLKDNRCSIYDERPPSCREFECIWRSHTNIPPEFFPPTLKAFAFENATLPLFQINIAGPRPPSVAQVSEDITDLVNVIVSNTFDVVMVWEEGERRLITENLERMRKRIRENRFQYGLLNIGAKLDEPCGH